MRRDVFANLQTRRVPTLRVGGIAPSLRGVLCFGVPQKRLSAPCKPIFVGRLLAEKGEGCIVNIGSVAGGRPLTQGVTYSNAKAAVASFTQWLAVHMAQEYSPRIRENAIAPGFVVTEQNRFLLIDDASGQLTVRGEKIRSQVPMKRYGTPEEIAGLALWLVSSSASFMTGAVIPVDGGFSAYAGV